MVRTDVYSAIGAAFLSITAMMLQNLPVHLPQVLLAALFVYAMHTINRFVNRRTSTIIGSFREESYRRHEKIYLATAAASLLIALAIGFFAGRTAFLILLCMSVFGALYNAGIFPRSWRFRGLKDLPGSKNMAMATAWATVTAVLPQISREPVMTSALAVAFCFVFGLVFIRSALSDIHDIQSDKLIGRETIPVLIGREQTQRLLTFVSAFLLLLLCLAWPAGWTSALSLFLASTIFYIWICFKVYDRKPGFSGVVVEGILETNYVLAGICSVLWIYLMSVTAV